MFSALHSLADNISKSLPCHLPCLCTHNNIMCKIKRQQIIFFLIAPCCQQALCAVYRYTSIKIGKIVIHVQWHFMHYGLLHHICMRQWKIMHRFHFGYNCFCKHAVVIPYHHGWSYFFWLAIFFHLLFYRHLRCHRPAL